MIGIYMYENKVNGKKYIGQSININRRRREHLKNPSPSSKFDNYLVALGEENFNFSVLEECTTDLLDEREQYWIKYYNSIEQGYNLSAGGQSKRGAENVWARLTDTEVLEIIKANKMSQIDKTSFFVIMKNGSSDLCRLFTRELKSGCPKKFGQPPFVFKRKYFFIA